MALQVEVGTVAGDGTTSNLTKTLADATLTPKLLILFAAFGSAISDARQTFGATDGTNQFGAHFCSAPDATDPTDGNRGLHTDRCYVQQGFAGGTIVSAAFVSFAAGSFTISQTVANTQTLIYLVIGGDDFECQVGSGTTATTATTKAFTTAFRPKAVLLVGSIVTASGGGDGDACLSIGAATGTAAANNVHASYEDEDAQTDSDTYGSSGDTACFKLISGAGAGRSIASLSAFNATDFTLNFTTSDGTAYLFGWIAMGGTARYEAIAATQGTTDLNWSNPMTAVAALSFSGESTTNNTITAHANMGIGAMAGAEQRSIAAVSQDGQTAQNTARETDTNTFVLILEEVANGDDAAVATGVFDATGLTLTWATDDGDGRRIGFLGIAPSGFQPAWAARSNVVLMPGRAA